MRSRTMPETHRQAPFLQLTQSRPVRPDMRQSCVRVGFEIINDARLGARFLWASARRRWRVGPDRPSIDTQVAVWSDKQDDEFSP